MIRGLPRYADGSMVNVPRSTFTGSTWNHSQIRRHHGLCRPEHRFNDDWAFKVGAVQMTEDNEAKPTAAILRRKQ